MTNFDYDAHIKNEQIKANLTPEQLQELKDLYVERLVDNMSTKDLVRYVFDDMTDYVDKQSPVEFFDDAYSYFDDYFDELVEEIKGGQFENDLHQEKIMSMTPKELIKEVYEIAFGEDAYLRGFFPEEVVARIQEFSDGSNPILIEEAWNEAEELNTSLRELNDSDLVACRQALIDRTNRIMEALNEIGTEEQSPLNCPNDVT